jgi:hypothetical protein
MDLVKQGWQRVRSAAAKMWQPACSKIEVASLLKKAKPQQPEDLILPLAVLIGAVAFGLWRQSLAAALFASVALFLLASIYNNTGQMLAALRRSEGEQHFGDVNARALAEPTMENNVALNQAIECLKPWLANQVSLTEDNAKECCAVVLDSVAGRARSATNNF